MNSYLWQGNSELRNQPLTKQSTTSVLHCHKDKYLRITSTAILFPLFSRHHEERANNDNEDNKKHKGPSQHIQDNNAKITVPVHWMHIWNGKRQRWTRCRAAIGPLNWHTHRFTGQRCTGSRQSRKGPTTHSICCGMQRGMVIFSNSRVTGKDRVVQLLECCDKQLRKF